MVLTQNGYISVTANDGIDALTTYVQNSALIKLVVTDLMMPTMDGANLTRALKRINPKVQIIILTGHGTELDEEEARKLGAFHYHKKPIDIDELLGTVKKAYRERIEDAMVAATLAQAGDFEGAREILDEGK